MGHRLDTSEQRAANSEQGGEQMPKPVRFDTQKGSRSEVLADALGRSSKQHEPPRNPAQKSYGAENRERSVRNQIGSTSSSPREILFFFLVLLLL